MVYFKKFKNIVFIGGIKDNELFMFYIKRKDWLLKTIGTFKLDSNMPFQTLLKCKIIQNCLRIKIINEKKYNSFLIFIYPK